MTRATTRRTILAGLAAAPVAGIPALAMAEPAVDPVFALIEEWRRLEDLHIVAIDENARLQTRESDKAQTHACRHVQEFERTVLFEAQPTTSAGAAALLLLIADLIEPNWGGECAPALRAAANAIEKGA